MVFWSRSLIAPLPSNYLGTLNFPVLRFDAAWSRDTHRTNKIVEKSPQQLQVGVGYRAFRPRGLNEVAKMGVPLLPSQQSVASALTAETRIWQQRMLD